MAATPETEPPRGPPPEDRGETPRAAPRTARTPRARALDALARREMGLVELRRRLAAQGVAPAEAAAVVEGLAAAGLQSDPRFVDAFVRSRLARGQGPLKIRAELAARGVQDAALLAEIDPLAGDWEAWLRRAWEKRFHGAPPGDAAEAARQTRFLIARGFPVEAVRRFLRGLGRGTAPAAPAATSDDDEG